MTQQDQYNDPDNKSPLKLLIADDDQPTRMLLRAATSQWGYEIVEATNGEEAWEVLQLNNPPTLLIIDWLMPKLDGIELCKRIRKENNNPYFPYIILLTQMKGSENIINGLDAGANEFLSKPFNMAELRSRLSVGGRMIQYSLAIQKIFHLANNSNKEINDLINLIKSQQTDLSKYHKIHMQIETILEYCNQFNLTKKE